MLAFRIHSMRILCAIFHCSIVVSITVSVDAAHVRKFLTVTEEHSWSCYSLRRMKTGRCPCCSAWHLICVSLPTVWVCLLLIQSLFCRWFHLHVPCTGRCRQWAMSHCGCQYTFAHDFAKYSLTVRLSCKFVIKLSLTRMWTNAQRDGHPAEYRWRPLFNAAKLGWCPLLDCRAVTLPRRETHWNLQGCPKLLTDLSH